VASSYLGRGAGLVRASTARLSRLRETHNSHGQCAGLLCGKRLSPLLHSIIRLEHCFACVATRGGVGYICCCSKAPSHSAHKTHELLCSGQDPKKEEEDEVDEYAREHGVALQSSEAAPVEQLLEKDVPLRDSRLWKIQRCDQRPKYVCADSRHTTRHRAHA
jgi:hypothetical protein